VCNSGYTLLAASALWQLHYATGNLQTSLYMFHSSLMPSFLYSFLRSVPFIYFRTYLSVCLPTYLPIIGWDEQCHLFQKLRSQSEGSLIETCVWTGLPTDLRAVRSPHCISPPPPPHTHKHTSLMVNQRQICQSTKEESVYMYSRARARARVCSAYPYTTHCV